MVSTGAQAAEVVILKDFQREQEIHGQPFQESIPEMGAFCFKKMRLEHREIGSLCAPDKVQCLLG
jgi:hypothetical protein